MCLLFYRKKALIALDSSKTILSAANNPFVIETKTPKDYFRGKNTIVLSH